MLPSLFIPLQRVALNKYLKCAYIYEENQPLYSKADTEVIEPFRLLRGTIVELQEYMAFGLSKVALLSCFLISLGHLSSDLINSNVCLPWPKGFRPETAHMPELKECVVVGRGPE